MHTYEVKFHSLKIPENMISKSIFDDKTFESENILESREKAFDYLKFVLQNYIYDRILFFKNQEKGIFEAFDLELIKDKNGDCDLTKIHQFPVFFNNWQMKISLLFDGKEILIIGNINSMEDYENLTQNSKEEFEINLLDEEKYFGFHQIPFENLFLYKKIRQNLGLVLKKTDWDEELKSIMKII